MNKKIILISILLVLLITLLGCTQQEYRVPDELAEGFNVVKLNIYDSDNSFLFSKGLVTSNSNAFEVVKEMLDNNLDYQEYDFGVFITSILGVTPDSTHFWSLYINGEKASQGISSYIIDESILIEFKLEELQTFE